MDCRSFAAQLDDLLDARLDAGRVGALEAHAAGCAACGLRLKAGRLLLGRLRVLPVPPPPVDFAERALARAAAPAARPAPVLGYALAASLALGVGLAAWFMAPPEDAGAPVDVVLLAPGEAQPVRMVFRSPRALSGVTVHLRLPEGVELAGYAGRSELRWQADLQSGANLLELPVLVQPGADGILTASLSYGQDRREFSVQVQARGPAVPFLKLPAATRVAAPALHLLG